MCACKNVCVQKKKCNDRAASFAMFVQYMRRKRKSILYFLYWFLHFARHVLKASHCVQLFSELPENNFFIPPLLSRDFHHTLSGWPEGPCVTYLLLRSLPLSLTTAALRIVVCSFPRQPTRTCVQRGLTDVEWKNMKQWLLSQKRPYLLLDIQACVYRKSQIEKVILKCKLFFIQA